MPTPRRKYPRRPDGFSLVEALISGAILIVGLTGITLMLTRGAVNGRNGQQASESSAIVTTVLADFQAAGFDNLATSPAGSSFDAGTAVDGGVYVDASGRVYNVLYVVNDITASMPTGATIIPTYTVDVEVQYRDGTGRMVYKRGGTIMSRAPDAGP
jgi:Tfp pilus assembly protein PilV